MKIHNLIQGSRDWKAYRAQHFNASDAPAMMGVSPHKSRAELLREMHTGVAADVDAGTQARFDNGHRVEALARPLAEQIIGEELYPVTGSEGKLSASFDGLTLDEGEGFEHKALNNELRAAFRMIETISPEYREFFGCHELPIYHRIQMEQQLLISKARRMLFMASEWTADEELVEEQHCYYYPDHALRAQIIDGWVQFEKDLAAYKLPQSAEAAPVGKAPDTLPALRIEVTGQVTASNLAEFKATALGAIRSVNRDLKTDQDFADAEKAVKWCGEVESRLAAAKEHALSQTASIDELFRTVDDISAEARRVRLDLEKLVKARKEAVKAEIVTEARRAYEQHEDALRAETGGPWIVLMPPDWAGAIKGLRTVDSIRNAVDSTLASAKIKADESARRIRESLRILAEDGVGFEFLFSDRLALIGKGPDDLRLLVASRIAAHKAAEAKRLEAERERIRAEEEAKAKRAAEEAERQRVAAEQAAAALAAAKITQRQDSQQVLKAKPETADATASETPAITSPRVGATGAGHPADAGPVADEPATLNLGTICERLGFTVTAAFLADVLHVKHSATYKSAKIYRESDWPVICGQLISHVGEVAQVYGIEVAV